MTKLHISVQLKGGGFPYFVGELYGAKVLSNTWYLPASNSVYVTKAGSITVEGEPLAVPSAKPTPLNVRGLYIAIQEGRHRNTSFRDFLRVLWSVGVIRYTVDTTARTVTYYGGGSVQTR